MDDVKMAAGMKLQGAVVLVAIFAYSYLPAAKQVRLNVPRVLLPLVPTSGIKSNFTLKSQQGCFTWYVRAVLCCYSVSLVIAWLACLFYHPV